MIDIHAHILPGVDDGAADLETAIEMADLAHKSGVTAIVATSHSEAFFSRGRFRTDIYRTALHSFRKELSKVNNPIKIYSGMEVFADFDTPHFLKEKQLFTLNGSRYLLVEFPFRENADETTKILSAIRSMGFIPVIAHPERYVFIQSSPDILNVWHEMGCILQINKGSLFGRFGQASERLALEMVSRGFAHAVASDAHSHLSRTTRLNDAREFIADEFGDDAAYALFHENPRRIISNEPIRRIKPRRFN